MSKKLPFLLLMIGLAGALLSCRFVSRLAFPPTPAPNMIVRTQIVEVWITATPLAPTGLEPTVSAPTPTQESSTDSVTPPPELGEVRAGIQTAVDLYAQAYRQNDLDLLQQVVDQENKPFRRLVTSRFTESQAFFLNGFDFQFEVLSVEPREHGFYLAQLETENQLRAAWLFRQAEDGHWVLSEPTIEQIGEPVIQESEYFTYKIYPWAEDINPEIIEMMETARQQVSERLGKVPETKALVEIAPIYGLNPYTTMMAIAYYQAAGLTEPDKIYIYSPHSYAYGYYDGLEGWQKGLQTTLTHEYVHMTHNLVFDNAGTLAVWVTEGLAEFISQPEEGFWLACAALGSEEWIPIMDEEAAVYKQDLMHMNQLKKNTGLAYHEAHALVGFIVDEFGGIDGFWDLIDAFDESQDFQEAVKTQLRLDYADFNQLWQEWLAKECRAR
jgi:hypothetical protein